jgi:hypothetical protein
LAVVSTAATALRTIQTQIPARLDRLAALDRAGAALARARAAEERAGTLSSGAPDDERVHAELAEAANELAETVGARHWGPGRFRAALREAVADGSVERLSRDTYAPPPRRG